MEHSVINSADILTHSALSTDQPLDSQISFNRTATRSDICSDVTNEPRAVSYREIAQFAMLVIHTILTQRGIAEENLIQDSQYNTIQFPRCLDPRHEVYLARVFTATKSALKSQSAVGIQLQLFSTDNLSQIKEQWNLRASTGDGFRCEDDKQAIQALIDEIMSSASFLPESGCSVFRVCLNIDSNIRAPSQCIRLGGNSTQLPPVLPIVGYEQLAFRQLQNLKLQILYK